LSQNSVRAYYISYLLTSRAKSILFHSLTFMALQTARHVTRAGGRFLAIKIWPRDNATALSYTLYTYIVSTSFEMKANVVCALFRAHNTICKLPSALLSHSALTRCAMIVIFSRGVAVAAEQPAAVTRLATPPAHSILLHREIPLLPRRQFRDCGIQSNSTEFGKEDFWHSPSPTPRIQ